MDLFNLRDPVSAWSHGAWLLMSLPGAALLWRRAVGDRPRQLVLVGYTFCLAFCAGASTVYHSVRLPARQISQYLLFDHIGIYILIAGTYTPIAWTMMRGRWRVGTLSLVWLAAAAGAGLHLAFDNLPNWLTTSLYLAMGWGAIVCYFELGRITSGRVLRPLVIGGIVYSVGALVHILDWPSVWPGVVGAHEVFHMLVVMASVTHYRFMLQVIAPWDVASTSLWEMPVSKGRLRPSVPAGAVLSRLTGRPDSLPTRDPFSSPLEG